MGTDVLWMQSRTTPARIDRMLIAQQWDEGVMSLADLKVTPRLIGDNMSVDVSFGYAVIEGDDEDFQGNYLAREEFDGNYPLTAAPGANSRYDIAVFRANDTTAGFVGDEEDENLAKIEIIAGVVSATPVVPTTPDSAILLAIIGPILSTTEVITAGMISDQRRCAGRRDTPGTLAWRADTHVPNGWAPVNGVNRNRTTDYRLFEHIGVTYGAGDTTSTFGVGDATGRFLLGAGTRDSTTFNAGAVGGEVNHLLTVGEMPVHTHIQNAHNHTQDAHNHTQNAHTHTQNAHGHTQDAHNHGSTGNQSADHNHAYSGSAQVVLASGGGSFGLGTVAGSFSFSLGSSLTEAEIQTHTHTVGNATATNQATTATNIAATATNIAATATNQVATATNQNAGLGQTHNNMPPYLTVGYCIVRL